MSREKLVGRAVFLAGLAAWLWHSLGQLPYCFHDVHYMVSLESGLWGPSEWVHPLYVPTLALLRGLLGLFGYEGRMFLPAEIMNVLAAGATLGLLFRAAEQLSGDSLGSAAAALLVGLAPGFREAALRSDPYALASACSVASVVLLSLDRPADPRLRFALAGVTAGMATGYHAGGLALVLVGMGAALLEGRSVSRLAGVFVAGWSLTVAASLAALVLFHGVDMGYIGRADLADMFGKIEQIPGTSIYTNRDLSRQAAEFLRVAARHGVSGYLALTAGLFALAGAFRALRPAPARPRTAALSGRAGLTLWLVALNAAAYSLFFLINNAQNGFIFAALLPAPLAAAISASWASLPRVAFIVASLGLGLSWAGSGPMLGPDKDPMRVESLFLGRLLRPGDMMLMPGCPFSELLYERRLNLLPVSDSGSACMEPSMRAADLPGRISQALDQGRRVYYAEGDLGKDFLALSSEDKGIQKYHQIYSSRSEGLGERAAGAAGLRSLLKRRFRLACGILSPQKWEYCMILPGPRPVPRPAGDLSAAAAAGRQLVALAAGFPLDGMGLVPRERRRYLEGWLSEAPGDSYAQLGLAGLLAEHLPSAGDAGPGLALKLAKTAALSQAVSPDPGLRSLRAEVLAAFDRASRELKAREGAEKLGPEELRLRGLASLHREKGEPEQVLAALDALARLRPKEASLQVERAQVLVELGRKPEALAALARGRQGAPPRILRHAAWVYQSMGDCPAALEIWRELVALPETSAKDLSDKAVCEFRQGHWEAAVADLRQSLSKDPGSLEAYASLAAVYSSRGLHDKALDAYDRGLALKTKPEEISLRKQLVEGRGLVLRRMGRTEDRP